MGELVGTRRRLADQRRRRGCVEGIEHRVFPEVRHGYEHVDVECRPDDRRQSEHGVGRLAQATETPADHLAHPLGDTELGDLEVGGPHAVALDDAS